MGTEHLLFHITEKRGQELMVGKGSGGPSSQALFSVQLLV